jgi:hypothetical protein
VHFECRRNYLLVGGASWRLESYISHFGFNCRRRRFRLNNVAAKGLGGSCTVAADCILITPGRSRGPTGAPRCSINFVSGGALRALLLGD